MKFIRGTLWLIGATCSAGIAHGADNGVYVGGALGQSGTELRVGNFGLEDNAAGYRLFAGFRPIDRFAGELEFVDFGEAGNSSGSAHSRAVGGFVVGFLPLAPTLEVFGKLGFSSWKTSASGLAAALRGSGSDLSYGAGLQLHLASFSTRLEYEQFDFDSVENQRLISLGVSWTFL